MSWWKHKNVSPVRSFPPVQSRPCISAFLVLVLCRSCKCDVFLTAFFLHISVSVLAEKYRCKAWGISICILVVSRRALSLIKWKKNNSTLVAFRKITSILLQVRHLQPELLLHTVPWKDPKPCLAEDAVYFTLIKTWDYLTW